MTFTHRILAGLLLATSALLGSGCTTTVVLMHLHEKLTEGDPVPCMRLSTVARALESRCGAYEPSRLVSKDIRDAQLPECPLTLAARDPQFWPVLPDLLAAGALPEHCSQPPLVALAQAQACPNFGAASPAARDALRWLARGDARSVHHDVVRLLSCPDAQAAGLTPLIDEWLAQGLLEPSNLAFSPLDALHPSLLGSPLAGAMEAAGHRADAGLGAFVGRQPSSFEVALQSGDLAALDWWLRRVPSLANKVPPSLGGQLPWRPLARLVMPNYASDPVRQRSTAEFLLSRGADPWLRLPQEPQRTVVSLARDLKSPLLPLLDVPPLRRAGFDGPKVPGTSPAPEAHASKAINAEAGTTTAAKTQLSALAPPMAPGRSATH